MAKILKKIHKIKCLCWPKSQYCIIIAFGMLKMEFKFNYTKLVKKVQPIKFSSGSFHAGFLAHEFVVQR